MEDRLVKVIQSFIVRRTSRERLNSIHGWDHWQRVEMFGRRLAYGRPEVNLKVVRLFAYLHDSCRENDGHDLCHGPRAAQLIDSLQTSLLKELTDVEFCLLRQAVDEHTTRHEPSVDPTIDACIDADRLDLERPGVGIKPDPKRMLTERGAEIALGSYKPK